MQEHLGILLKYHVLFIGVGLHGMCNVSAMWLVLAQFQYNWIYRNENKTNIINIVSLWPHLKIINAYHSVLIEVYNNCKPCIKYILTVYYT